MKHLEASQLLSDHAAGSLSPDRIQELDAHIAGCQECHEWVATYRLLAGSLAETSSRQHLSSQALCDLALDSPDLSLAARVRGERHLKSCPECSHEVALVRSAARESAETTVPIRSLAGKTAQFVSRGGWLALAATLVLVIGGLVVVSAVQAPVPEEYRLVGDSVRRDRTIKAGQSILVEATEVESGSLLNLQSAVVAFGDGFSVESGAGLVVGTATNGL